jgi:hypothetical protein
VTALKLRGAAAGRDREHAASGWTETSLVFTTGFGTPIEPRNFTRSFDLRIGKAQVRRISVHGSRPTSHHRVGYRGRSTQPTARVQVGVRVAQGSCPAPWDQVSESPLQGC